MNKPVFDTEDIIIDIIILIGDILKGQSSGRGEKIMLGAIVAAAVKAAVVAAMSEAVKEIVKGQNVLGYAGEVIIHALGYCCAVECFVR